MANHLIAEKSPYLLQHAHNPVDWRPWSQEAFDLARQDDKPIFLSIGYSTCHWCHVMERESFENDQIAAVLNRSFIPIKVDREERPDVDRIYMTFVQATTGSGGWPMSVFLTPDLKPFFGGTYFPPDNRYGRPGFLAILESLSRAWREDRAKITESSKDVVSQLLKMSNAAPSRAGSLDKTILDSAFSQFRRTYDSTYGGFGGAPKFPRPAALNFLLRYYSRTGNEEALEMVLHTLRAMADGGMNDQLGGGFHRYSVDELWFLPHFEKMMYDQAQLVVSYLEAFQISKDPFYAQVARNTLDYILREMTDKDGGFYSAEDADSVIDPAHPHEKGEGAFYVWSRQEIDSALDVPSAATFAYRFGIETAGNVHNDPHGEFPGKNILFVNHDIEETASHFNLTPDAVQASLDAAARKLLELRANRVRPHLDDKVLTAWNGLTISAFAKAAQILGEPRYAQAARRAASFLLTRMWNPETGVLLRRYRDGDAAIPGFLDDYAFFAQALLDLYETDFQTADLDAADVLIGRMLEMFEDKLRGGFFSTAAGDANLVMRVKDDYDGAEPSGNSIALLDLLRLAQLTGRAEYAQAAERTLTALGSQLIRQPTAVPQLLVGLDRYLSPKRQIVLAGDPSSAGLRPFLHEIRSRFLPHHTLILVDSEAARERLGAALPELRGMLPLNGRPTAYVCENYACQLPVTELSNFRELLQ